MTTDLNLVASSEYDALCDLFREVCGANLLDESDLRICLRDLGDDAIEWGVEVLRGANSEALFK